MKLLLPLILLSLLTFLSINHRHGAIADSTCPKNCRPYAVQIHCNKTSGECSEGCITGFFGLTCNKICQCGGGACAVTDGTCMQTPTVKPVPVSPGHQTEEFHSVGFLVGIGGLCVVVVILISVIVFLKVKSKRSGGQRFAGQEGRPLILEQLPNTEKKLLANELGVHVLYHSKQPNKPVCLYCVHIKFDYRRVNTSTSHINRDRYLVNEPEMKSKMDQFPERFKTFSGTTGLSPTIHGDAPTYWEVKCNVQLEDQLQPTDVLLCIGFCREGERDEDDCPQTPVGENCYNLNVGIFSEPEQICSKIYRGKKAEPITIMKTDIDNKKGQTGNLNYGILVCKGKKVIMYFDLAKMERIDSLENVDFERPLWPMFGVIKKSVKMLLVTGKDIKMSPSKTDMIISALPSV